MKKVVSAVVVFTLILAMAVMAGCSKDKQSDNGYEAQESSGIEENATPVQSTTPEQPADNKRVITDQTGRQVELPNVVDRVITTWRPSTSLLFAIGGQEKLVGADNHSTENAFLLGIYPEIADVAKVGNRRGLNVETMVAAQPDVVFVWQGTDTDPVIAQLERQGIAAFVLVPESAEDMKQATLIMGEVIGHQEQAKEVIAYYEDTIAMIAGRLAHIPEEELPVAYMAGSGGLLNTVGGEYYQNSLIVQAGAKNAASALAGYGWQDVSAEQLVGWNPEYFFATQFFDEDLATELKKQAGLHTVKAVQDGNVYKFPANITSWDFPEPLSVLGILWMAKTMHPAEFADLDLQAEVDDYHKKFYGKTFTELGGNFDESNAVSIR